MEPRIVTRKEFLQRYWTYYLILEKNFLETEQYIAIDELNFNTYSNEYIKQYQTICSEIDVIAKSFCHELECDFKGTAINTYCKCILDNNADFSTRIVKLKNRNIQINPWKDWKYTIKQNNDKSKIEAVNPEWWKKYNKIKHDRTTINSETHLPYYKLANQKNVLYSLAALFQLELYYYRKLREKYFPSEPDMPYALSSLFEIESWGNTWIMFGENVGICTEED